MAENFDAVMQSVKGLSEADMTRLANELQPAINAQTQATITRSATPNTQSKNDISAQTIDAVRNAQANIQRNGINVATGFVGYDLKAPAAMLIPFMTPMVNMTPREQGVGVPVHNWKAVTDLFGGNGPMGVIGSVSDGGSPSFLSRSVVPMSNTFQTIGFQDSVTFQAEWRGMQLEGDLRAMTSAQLLYGLKLVEENWLINMSDYLWSPPPALVSNAATGGSVAAGTYYVKVTAVNANGQTLGSSLGTYSSTTTTGTTSVLNITIFTVPNAASYNVYVASGASYPGDASCWKQSVSANQPSSNIQGSFTVSLTTTPVTSGTALSSVAANTAQVAKDGSNNSLTFKGAQALVYANAGSVSASGTGGLTSQVIQPAASNGYLAVSDIQNLFLNMFNNSRANPDKLFVSPQDSLTLSNLISTASNLRVNVDASNKAGLDSLTIGQRVGYILNQATQAIVEIVPLPFLAQGTMIAGSYTFPYPIAGYKSNPFRVITNQDYYGVEYPPTMANPTQYGFGDFVDETVVNEYLGGWGILNGIIFH